MTHVHTCFTRSNFWRLQDLFTHSSFFLHCYVNVSNFRSKRHFHAPRQRSMVIQGYRHQARKGQRPSVARTQWLRVHIGRKERFFAVELTLFYCTVRKTTLLKCLAELIPYTNGYSTLHGKKPRDYGVPVWRARVMYIPQRPSAHPGCPLDLFRTVKRFSSQKHKKPRSPVRKIHC